MRQEFWSIANHRNTCTIVGRYLLRADMREKEILLKKNNVFLLSGVLIVTEILRLFICIFNPMTIVEDETVFPHTIGKRT